VDAVDDPEGATPLDPDELVGLKFKHVTMRGQLDHLEQVNIQNGLRWLERRRNKGNVLQEGFVRELHEQLFGEVWSWAGTFRTTEKNIGILLGDVSYWIENRTYDPVETAVRLHHRLVYIHLFPNGNGRHARIMADVVLTDLMKLRPLDWDGGHNLQAINERRRNYIQALQQADRGDYSLLLQFVAFRTTT
jgi:Fic-DOC domain mobile mystery protein B